MLANLRNLKPLPRRMEKKGTSASPATALALAHTASGNVFGGESTPNDGRTAQDWRGFLADVAKYLAKLHPNEQR